MSSLVPSSFIQAQMKKDVSNERASALSVWCGIRTSAFSSRILTWGFHGIRASGFSTVPAGCSLLLTSEACPDSVHMQDQTERGKQPAKKQFLVNDLCCDYKPVFLCYGNQQEGASATEYERFASVGTSGLGDFFSSNRNMMLFALKSMYTRHLCCILAYKHMTEPAQCEGKSMH